MYVIARRAFDLSLIKITYTTTRLMILNPLLFRTLFIIADPLVIFQAIVDPLAMGAS